METSPLTAQQITRLQQGGGLYSQARNFLSHVSAGVDVRTGQFTLSITLPIGSANNLMGPELSATLTFSPLASLIDAGFGLGWSLVFSELDLRLNQQPSLRLSTGELYSVDLDRSDFNIGGLLAFHDRKLESFIVTRRAEDCYEVVMKSGAVELLYSQSDSSVFVTKEVRTQEGRQVFLSWATLPDSQTPMLTEIRDESRTLLLVSRTGGLKFEVNPGTARASTLELVLFNRQLRRVLLPGERSSYWEFTYDDMGGLLFPSQVKNPLGCEDTVVYAQGIEGHLLPPGAPLTSMARVRYWRHLPTPTGPQLISTYAWQDNHNFLGYGANLSSGWMDGRENLYQVVGGYAYGVTEIVSDDSGDIKTIKRVWNRFHLQVEETVTQGQNRKSILTEYDEDPDKRWEEQPAWCQLPVRVTTRFETSPTDVREEFTETTYDACGNILTSRTKEGVIEEREYYASGPSDGCPADPYGFVRWLRSYTVTPATLTDGTFGGATVLTTTYEYKILPSVIAEAPYHIVTALEITRDATHQTEIGRTLQSHIEDKGAQHGMVQQALTTLNGLTTRTDWTYTLNDDQLHTEMRITGFENTESVVAFECDARSIYDGLTVMEQRPAGAQTLFEFDVLGRVVETTFNAGSTYESKTTSSYQLPNAENQFLSMVEEKDALNVRQRTFLDGDGRINRTEIEDIDNAQGNFKALSSFKYDAQGRLIEETEYDWFPDSTTPLTLTTVTLYDDWGAAKSRQSSDGVTIHTSVDPVTLTTTTWTTSATGTSGASTRTTVNLAGSPVKIEVISRDDIVLRTRTLERDGLDRVVQDTLSAGNEPPLIHRFMYDAFNRVTTKTLPDGTKVDWEYALHSDDNHPLSVAVTPKENA